MPGVKTLSEPKEKPAGKGVWWMKLSAAFWSTGQGETEERHTKWTWGQWSNKYHAYIVKLLLKMDVSPCKPSFRKDITFGEKEKD